ncbi:MAG: ABC transporter ATP-binding protein/permease [Oscillospiraceae bacterium]|nr:ABC transporter ATP-binding protein/permease [Oscillospiraceae bacterium]
MISGFRKLFGLFNRRQKTNAVIMLCLIALGAVAETIGIGIILPFTTILLDRESMQTYPILLTIMQRPWIGGYGRFVVLMCAGLVIVFILKSLYMFFLLYIQNRFTLNLQIEMSKMLFNAYIHKPYAYFFKKNTAELQRNINTLVGEVIQGVLMNGLQLLTELMVIVLILILLLIIDPISTLSIGAVLGGAAVLYYFLLKGKMDDAAKRQNIYGAKMVKAVNEGLGSIKEVKVLGKERHFLNDYEKVGRGFAKTVAFYNLAHQSPRLLIETVAVSGLVVLVVINALRNPDISASLPMIALFGMAAMRIMPSLNRSIGFLANIRFAITHFNQIYDDLHDAKCAPESTDINTVKMSLTRNVVVRDLSFRYPGTDKNIFKNAELTIEKGQTIGIVGNSGAGKTTLIDLMLGLLAPDEGEILVDDVNIASDIDGLRQTIGYVPQDIYLIDDTIAANVAFGVSEEDIDINRLWASLEIANVRDYVQSLDKGISTVIGEKGVRLSGGQRQRLGIARAIYNDPEILIFDEATSALDNESERIISEAITTLGQTKTMIIIAHRPGTLEKCDAIYEIKDAMIQRKSS